MDNLNLVPKTNFEIWKDSDNVVKTGENSYVTQCTQYMSSFTEAQLKAYYIKEYCNSDFKVDGFDHFNNGYTGKLENEVYVKFLDSKNKFKETTKDFKTYDDAWKWVLETFDNPSKDFIYYY